MVKELVIQQVSRLYRVVMLNHFKVKLVLTHLVVLMLITLLHLVLVVFMDKVDMTTLLMLKKITL